MAKRKVYTIQGINSNTTGNTCDLSQNAGELVAKQFFFDLNSTRDNPANIRTNSKPADKNKPNKSAKVRGKTRPTQPVEVDLTQTQIVDVGCSFRRGETYRVYTVSEEDANDDAKFSLKTGDIIQEFAQKYGYTPPIVYRMLTPPTGALVAIPYKEEGAKCD